MNAQLSDPLALLDYGTLLSETEHDIQSTVAGFLADRARPSLPEWFDSGPIATPRLLVPRSAKTVLPAKRFPWSPPPDGCLTFNQN